MNQITHWLDASNIYGSADHEALILRSQNGGKLKVTKDGNMLPRCTNFADLNDGLESCHNTDMTCGNDCFAGGLYFISINLVFNLLNFLNFPKYLRFFIVPVRSF